MLQNEPTFIKKKRKNKPVRKNETDCFFYMIVSD